MFSWFINISRSHNALETPTGNGPTIVQFTEHGEEPHCLPPIAVVETVQLTECRQQTPPTNERRLLDAEANKRGEKCMSDGVSHRERLADEQQREHTRRRPSALTAKILFVVHPLEEEKTEKDDDERQR